MLRAARKKDTQLGRIAEREVKAASFIPYSRHFDDTTLKTKAGYLLKVIKIEGLPFETADQTDLNTRKNIRATLLRGISNSRFAVYHHTIRRRVSVINYQDYLRTTGAGNLITNIKKSSLKKICL